MLYGLDTLLQNLHLLVEIPDEVSPTTNTWTARYNCIVLQRDVIQEQEQIADIQ